MINLTIRTGHHSYYFTDCWQVEGVLNLGDFILVNEIRAAVTGVYYEANGKVLSVWAVEENLYEKERMFRTFPDISVGAFDDI